MTGVLSLIRWVFLGYAWFAILYGVYRLLVGDTSLGALGILNGLVLLLVLWWMPRLAARREHLDD